MLGDGNIPGSMINASRCAGGLTRDTLATDLVDWWENGADGGLHGYNVITNSPSVVSDPAGVGLDGFAQNAGQEHLISAFTPDRFDGYTIALAGKRTASYWGALFHWHDAIYEHARYGRALDGLGAYTNAGDQPLGSEHVGTYILVVDALGVSYWVNGVEYRTLHAAPHTSSSPISNSLQVALHSGDGLCILAVANRAWNAKDVAAFHNDGNFARYADLGVSHDWLLNAPQGSLLRNNYNGYVGVRFSVDAQVPPFEITHLGRWSLAANFQTHEVGIWDSAGATELASVDVDASLADDDFVWGELSSPLQVTPGEYYRLVSNENLGGDQWYNEVNTHSVTPAAPIYQAVYGTPTPSSTSSVGYMYGNLSFKYRHV